MTSRRIAVHFATVVSVGSLAATPGRRTSLIIDPPNGRLPALTPAAQKFVDSQRSKDIEPLAAETSRPPDRKTQTSEKQELLFS